MERKNGIKRFWGEASIKALCFLSVGGMLLCSGCTNASTDNASGTTKESKYGQGSDESGLILADTLERKLIKADYGRTQKPYTPSVQAYQANADLSNVRDYDRYYFNDKMKNLLAKNQFCITDSQYSEFFDIYENNRYMLYPSFITTDSMMHTYHLYFAMLQENTEKKYLISNVERLTSKMLANSREQYDKLKGSEWEEAAFLNVAYFSVAARLLGLNADVLPEASTLVDQEVQKIMACSAIDQSLLTDTLEDYSQYKPRGYYDGDEDLERYFRTMMWYGRINFAQIDEKMNRCALLMTLAMKDEECYANWDAVYEVTSFFVGQSDDCGYYEYLPMIEEAYGSDVSSEKLIGDNQAFEAYQSKISRLDPPKVNSVVFTEAQGDQREETAKGFRFMGQRFTLDEGVFSMLCYSKVDEAADGSKRMLPDGLDFPAALGSEKALEILKEQGNAKYPNYLENMEKVRIAVNNADDYWATSLYGGWLYTLDPLLEKKGDGYPSFMTNEEWEKKNIEGYLGSWTELKHDTVLYAKQMMAEMGGGDDWIIYDDRGYVEPEPDLYSRLYALTMTTMEGLGHLGVLADEDKEGLSKLGEIAVRLQEISIKELQNEKISDEEYDFIRDYGGALEHLWVDTVKNKATTSYYDSDEFPMALVTDVATDPNGTCLQEAIGGASKIYVIFPIDGELHIGVGGVYHYYQFEQPISNRLTDKDWRIMLGMQLDDNDEYHYQKGLRGPDWTLSYRYIYEY